MVSKARLLLVSPNGRMGGAVSLVAGLAKEHAELGLEAMFIGHAEAAEVVAASLPVLTLRSTTSTRRIAEARRTVRRIARNEDVVLALDNFPLMSGRREIVVAHNALLLSRASALSPRRIAWRLTKNQPLAYVAPTEWMARQMRAQGFKRVTSVPHGGLLEAHKQKARPPQEGRMLVIGLGLPSPQKNFGSIVAACALARCKPDLALTVESRSAHAESLRRMSEEVGIPAERLHFLGTLNRREVAGVLASSNVLVFPSTIESFGLPLVEAMQVGLPVVASDAPWAREICGQAALYAEARDAVAIAAHIDILYEDEVVWRRAAELATQRGSIYRWAETARRYSAIIQATESGKVGEGGRRPRK